MGNPTDWGNTPHYKAYQKARGKTDNKGPTGKRTKPARIFARHKGIQAASADPMRGKWIWLLHAPKKLQEWWSGCAATLREELDRFNNPVPPL